MATIVKSSGLVEETRPANGRDFTLSELQAIVGGFIEIVPLDEEHIMVVNEEGLLKGLDENKVATSLYHRKNKLTTNYIVGDVLVCRCEEVK